MPAGETVALYRTRLRSWIFPDVYFFSFGASADTLDDARIMV
jgi:hypothetical protein